MNSEIFLSTSVCAIVGVERIGWAQCQFSGLERSRWKSSLVIFQSLSQKFYTSSFSVFWMNLEFIVYLLFMSCRFLSIWVHSILFQMFIVTSIVHGFYGSGLGIDYSLGNTRLINFRCGAFSSLMYKTVSKSVELYWEHFRISLV